MSSKSIVPSPSQEGLCSHDVEAKTTPAQLGSSVSVWYFAVLISISSLLFAYFLVVMNGALVGDARNGGANGVCTTA